MLAARQSINNTSGRVRIILDPPNLGQVNLDILVRNESVDVLLTTDNTGVQQALQSRADDLRAALQRQDFRIENLQVLFHHNEANHQQRYGGNTFGQASDKNEEPKQKVGDITVKPLIGRTMGQSGPIQGLVSVFV
jgi:flagellar hook-length control protein FliK